MQALNAALKDNIVPGLSHSLNVVRHHTARIVAAGIAAATTTETEPSLPAAGLDVAASQEIWCTLLQAAHTASDNAKDVALAPQHWLQAWRASQAASDRLLHDLHRVQANLHFWQAQLRDGSEGTHLRFLLLARGPIAFLHDVTCFLQQLWGQPPSSAQSHGAWDQPLSATNQIQHRVMVLQAMQQRLVTALAQVHHAAAHLRLDTALCYCPAQRPLSSPGSAPAAGGSAILQQASAAASRCALETRRAIDQLQGGMQEWLAQLQPRRQEQPAAAPAASPSARPWRMDALLQLLSEPRREDHGHLTPTTTRDTFGIAPSEAGAIIETLLGGEAKQPGEGAEAAAAAVDSVAGCLAAARLGAAAAPPLVRLPSWLRMPSQLQRHWPLYCLRAAAGAAALRFLYRHSRLAGSTDLERWAGDAAQAVAQAWVAHVAQPLANVRAELFHTFRDRPCIVSPEDFKADEQSLLRMLGDFARDKGVSSSGASPEGLPLGRTAGEGLGAASGGPGALLEQPAAGSTAAGAGMQLVMLSYEAELRSPLRNLLIGDLARAMLIQVQRLKLDTEAAMLQLDQILRASELSISLMAALPALLVSWGLLAAAASWLRPRAPDVKHKAVPLRMAAAELQRSMQGLMRLRQGQGQQEEAGAQGLVLYNLSEVHREAVRLYRHYDRTSRYSEYPHLMSDLHELAALVAGEGEAGMAGQALDRILRTHRAFQHA